MPYGPVEVWRGQSTAPKRLTGTVDNMSNTERFRIADAINDATIRVPRLPTGIPDTAAEFVYVRSRVSELLELWGSHGIQVLGVQLCASKELLDAVSGLEEVDGVVLHKYLDDFAGAETARGAFLCEPQALHPATVLLRPALGLAYSGPVSPAVYEIRWVLQEHDRLGPDEAQDIAERI